MKLDEFIFESIKQVIDGIDNAREYAETKGAKISGENLNFIGAKNGGGVVYMSQINNEIIEKIDFDIAVVAKEGDKAKGGVGLFVGAVGMGIQGHTESENSSMSRIKFSVPLHLPKKKQ
ncbi:MAG: hypothetical protein KF803_16025 [Cyclobacteriaceae bacterium]|nr:hypothetical protein [Cyclobacteriaceae bacterium]